MKKILLTFFFLLVITLFLQCKNNDFKNDVRTTHKNEITHAKAFILENYNGFSILKVVHPWPQSNKIYTYILKSKSATVPDSLKKYTLIDIPIKSIIVTSTTHIPSLEMLNEEHSLVGFPNLNYISSEKVHLLIDEKKIVDVGHNNSLNIEKIIELQPQVLIGYGSDNNNPALHNLEKNGIKVLLNGDWNEQTPLGKAEWLKFFGALFNKQIQANKLFKKIEFDYNQTVEIAKKANSRPTVLSGDMYQNSWFMPKGESWAGVLLKQANANYLWSDTKGSGSLSLSFEKVLTKAQQADFWFTSGQFENLNTMLQSNPHYEQFRAFKNKNVFSFGLKKGRTGGILYYELGPNRPDIVLKDMVKILHPELLPGYQPFFYQKLK